MQRLLPTGIAFFVLAGAILARFSAQVVPTSYLLRPLVVALVLAAAIGLPALTLGRYAEVAAGGLAVLVVAPSVWTLVAAAIVGVGLFLASAALDLRLVAAVVAGVFMLGGLVAAVPLLSFQRHPRTGPDGPPVYMFLLDGYPRIDTLAGMGIDNRGFVEELESRGFDHDPRAGTATAWTHHTLTELFGGVPGDGFGTVAERRQIRSEWTLPDGFVTVSPPAGHVTIPGARDIGPYGINDYEIALLGSSVFAELSDGLVMDALRSRLDASLDTLAGTEKTRVFAHLMAPHTPYLYGSDGEPLPIQSCWPDCQVFTIDPGLTDRERIDGLSGTLDYMNRRLLETVDDVITKRPNATILLFSDHGGRFSPDDTDEWYRTFYAARDPSGELVTLLADR